MNPGNLFIDVASGRFLENGSTTFTDRPTIFSDEKRRYRVSVLKSENGVVSIVTPSETSEFKIRLGTPEHKLSDGEAIPTASPVLFTAQATVVTDSAKQAKGVGIVATYSPVTATFKAILSNETAVTATFRTFIDYIAPVTAVISVGITSATSFISASTFSAALNDFSEIEDIYRFGEGNGQDGIKPLVLELTASLNSPVAALFSGTFSGGTVTSISIVNRGSGYPNGEFDLVFSGGGATAGTVTATAYVVASGGIIQSVTIEGGGSGYGSMPTISLFTPEKSIRAISATNSTGIFNNKQRFLWAYGTTSVSTPAADIYFSAPDATSTTALLTVPSATINFVEGNTWEIQLKSGGYGYVNTPTVTHGEVLVAAPVFKISAQTGDPTFNTPNQLRLKNSLDLSKTAYIRNGGVAIQFNMDDFYWYFKPDYIPFVFMRLPNKGLSVRTNSSGQDFTSGPVYGNVGGDLGQVLIPDAEKVGSQLIDYSFNGRYSFVSLEKDSASESDIQLLEDFTQYGNQLVESFFVIKKSKTASGKSAVIKISTAEIKGNYNIIFNATARLSALARNPVDENLSKTFIYPGGGSFEPTIEVIDFGDSYTQNDIGLQKVRGISSIYTQLTSLRAGQTIFESPFASTVAVPTSSANNYIDTILSFAPTVLTRPGQKSVEYYIGNGGFGFQDIPLVNFSSNVVATGGVVVTASITNKPAVYAPGVYDCIVQNPSSGTAARLQLIAENGDSVGRAKTFKAIILDGGAGYTSAPVITAPSPNGANGIFKYLQVTNKPSGYRLGVDYPIEIQASPVSGGDTRASVRFGESAVRLVGRNRGAGFFLQEEIVGLPTNAIVYGRASYTTDLQPSEIQSGFPSSRSTQAKWFVANISNFGFGYTTAPSVTAPSPDSTDAVVS